MVGSLGRLHFGQMLGNDLLLGTVRQTTFDALAHHLGKPGQPFAGAGRDGPLRAGAFGVHIMAQAFIDPLVDFARQGDGGHLDIGGGIGALGLATTVVKQGLFQDQTRSQTIQRGQRDHRPQLWQPVLGPCL